MNKLLVALIAGAFASIAAAQTAAPAPAAAPKAAPMPAAAAPAPAPAPAAAKAPAATDKAAKDKAAKEEKAAKQKKAKEDKMAKDKAAKEAKVAKAKPAEAAKPAARCCAGPGARRCCPGSRARQGCGTGQEVTAVHSAAARQGASVPCLFSLRRWGGALCCGPASPNLAGVHELALPRPAVTVATVVARDGAFLLVEETTRAGVRFNQPAGHLEPGETLIDAAVRETLEETGHHVRPVALVGIYRWQAPETGATFLRFAYAADVLGHDRERPLDEGILRTHWLTYEALVGCRERHRSPLVLRCVDDFRAGRRHPADLVVDCGTADEPRGRAP